MRSILLTARGLEGIACREVKEVLPEAAIVDQGRGAVLLDVAGPPGTLPRPLLDLHSIDDLYAEVVVLDGLDPRRNPLALLAKTLRYSPTLDEALALRWASRAAQGTGRRCGGDAGTRVPHAPTFRVMSQMEGRQPFRRIDAQRAVEESLGRLYPRWVLLDEGAPDLQFAVWVSGRTCRVGLRLVEAGFARRPWKVGHIPASLPPSIAYGLLRTAGITAGEVMLDPFCGAGTILVERGRVAPPAGSLLGSDLSLAAREAAAANAAQSGVALSLHDWDATALPLDAASIDTIVTNPPYGQRHGLTADLPRLYGGFLDEAARVLRPGGRCVVLTSEVALMENLLAARPDLARRKRFSVDVLGLMAYAHLLERVSPSG